jgi:hypothetical protein
MNQTCLRISLAVLVLLASSQLGSAMPQNSLAMNGPATAAARESSPAPAASSYPDAPSALTTPGVAETGAEQPRLREAAPAAKGGLNRAIDGKYVVVMSAMFAASIVNVEKTNTCLEQHTCAFVPEAFRSRGALYGAGIPAEVGIAYLGYKLKEHRHRWWLLPAMVVTGGNSFVAYHSATENSSPRTSK